MNEIIMFELECITKHRFNTKKNVAQHKTNKQKPLFHLDESQRCQKKAQYKHKARE